MRTRRSIAYSEAELAFVWARRTMPRREIHAAFVAKFRRRDVTTDNIKALCTRQGWNTRARWDLETDARLIEHFPHMATARLATMLGCSPAAAHHRARRLGLAKTAAYLASPEAGRLQSGDSRGRTTRFKPGQVPPNKGIKHPEGWAPGRMRDTQFTKGQKAWNWKPIGSGRVIDGYHYTKVGDAPSEPYTVNWRQTHILNWEALHGALPEAHALKCIDGNRLNTDPSNWTLIPRAILPRLNGGRAGRIAYDQAPDELKPTIMAVAKLSHAAKSRGRAKAGV